MEPKQNDVLSGRGACFNQHPGNKRFRRMLETQIDSYTKGTKKQKMVISHAIVDAVYSLEPPGRFLKKCDSNTILWKELSRKEASNKAAQAMAYAVRAEMKLKPQILSASSQPHASSSSHVTAASTASASRPNADDNPRGYHEIFNDKPNLQQELLHRQQSQSNTIPFTSSLGLSAPQNGNGLTQLGRAHLLSQAQIQQQNQLQQQRQMRSQYLLGRHELMSQARIPSSQHSSIQSLSSLGRIPPSFDFLRQEHSLRNNYGAGVQPSSSAQRQRNAHGQHGASNNYMSNQSMLNAAIASQHGAQLQDQEHRAAMLRNLFGPSSLAASSRQPQSQQLSLPQHQAALLQRNLQYPHPNISAQEVEVELREDNAAPTLTREGRGGMDEGEGG